MIYLMKILLNDVRFLVYLSIYSTTSNQHAQSLGFVHSPANKEKKLDSSLVDHSATKHKKKAEP